MKLFTFLSLTAVLMAPNSFADYDTEYCNKFQNNPYYKGHQDEAVAFCKEDKATLRKCRDEAAALYIPAGEKFCPSPLLTGEESQCGKAHIKCVDESNARWDAFMASLKD